MDGAESPHDAIFWEMEGQTAVRRGPYKLVLNGVLCEGEPPQDVVFLSDLRTDPAEQHNLASELPELTQELTAQARNWRAGIERTWDEKWAAHYHLT
ncbi:MAG: hypothetical protein IKM54_01505, partial [Butyricicoccus sp.]|nr:hypothetical protein [Butyricicoccus sp.]